jgi:succinate dehydrogenase / fumarate reductase iron-sulfur subunit
MSGNLEITLKVWRQEAADSAGSFQTYQVSDVSPDSSFLEMLDQLNETLITEGKIPITFEHDCREGICGSCGFMINGQAHGPERGTTVCQLHMRSFKSGATLVLEPWRAKAFPVLQDLLVDRAPMDRIQAAGGYCSTNVGNAPEANANLMGRKDASEAFLGAACIGCGACVASCKNASASLFTAAKIGQLALTPQGQPERAKRAARMVETMELEGFGACSNTYECEAACPKEIPVRFIQSMNREYLSAKLLDDEY